MSKICAIICELNPMHLGHKYVFEHCGVKNDEYCVKIAVMSGNFTQRCTPAVFDKYIRAEAAVLCGADIVLELPFPWCSSGAEDFALGGVSVASGVGAERLTFGSESGNLSLLERVAQIKSSEEYRNSMSDAERSLRKKGSAVIFDSVMRKFDITEPLGANDKLAGDYIRYGRQLGIKQFRALKRLAGQMSATDIRGIMFGGGFDILRDQIPSEAYAVFSEHIGKMCTETRYNDILHTYCRTSINNECETDILKYARSTARETCNGEEFIRSLPTKKYTLARMRREILHAVIGSDEKSRKSAPRFTILLAANERGRKYLAELRTIGSIPIITKPASACALDEIGHIQLKISQRADELYALCIGERADYFMKKHPVITCDGTIKE